MALFPMAIAVLGGYGLYRWWQVPVPERMFDQRFWLLTSAVVLGSLAAAALLALSKKILSATDFRKYDSHDPDEPSLKF
jgi:hypothetical protein